MESFKSELSDLGSKNSDSGKNSEINNDFKEVPKESPDDIADRGLNDRKDSCLKDSKDPIKEIETIFNKYQEKRPATFSEEIIDFLRANIQELKEDLDL